MGQISLSVSVLARSRRAHHAAANAWPSTTSSCESKKSLVQGRLMLARAFGLRPEEEQAMQCLGSESLHWMQFDAFLDRRGSRQLSLVDFVPWRATIGHQGLFVRLE